MSFSVDVLLPESARKLIINFLRSTIVGKRKSAEKAQEGLAERVGSISRATMGQRFGSMSRTTIGSRQNTGSIAPAPQKQSVTNLATRAFNVKKAVSAFKLQVKILKVKK